MFTSSLLTWRKMQQLKAFSSLFVWGGRFRAFLEVLDAKLVEPGAGIGEQFEVPSRVQMSDFHHSSYGNRWTLEQRNRIPMPASPVGDGSNHIKVYVFDGSTRVTEETLSFAPESSKKKQHHCMDVLTLQQKDRISPICQHMTYSDIPLKHDNRFTHFHRPIHCAFLRFHTKLGSSGGALGIIGGRS